MLSLNNVLLLKRKLATVKLKLRAQEERNETLTKALEYYGKYHNNWFGVGPGVAKEALKD